MDESLEGLAWLIAQIEALSSVMAALTGGVWPYQAPEGAVTPFCVITPMGGHDRQGVAGYRLFWEGPYQVRYWGDAGQMDAVKTAANTVDTALTRARATTSTVEIISCIRDNPLPPIPQWTGQALRTGIGGLYRLQVRAL